MGSKLLFFCINIGLWELYELRMENQVFLCSWTLEPQEATQQAYRLVAEAGYKGRKRMQARKLEELSNAYSTELRYLSTF